MREDKVVRLPSTGGTAPSRGDANTSPQPSLFGHDYDNRGKIVFLDVRWLAEEILLTLVVRNNVTCLIDLRPRPVFERPRFRHKNVVQYLYDRKVPYLEYAMLARGIRKLAGSRLSRRGDIEAWLGDFLGRGLTICLYDEGTRAAGWLDEIRQLIHFAPEYRAELHPRALAGLPEGVFSGMRSP